MLCPAATCSCPALEAVLRVVLNNDRSFARDLYPVSQFLASHVVDITNKATCQSISDAVALLDSPRWGAKKQCTGLHLSGVCYAEPPSLPPPLTASESDSKKPLLVVVKPAKGVTLAADLSALGTLAPRCPQLLRLDCFNLINRAGYTHAEHRLGPQVGAAVAAAAPSWPQLQHLDLRDNALGPEGAWHLAKAAHRLPQLGHLQLKGNSIGCQGAAALAEAAPHWALLQHLDLSSNDIKAEGAHSLEAAFQHFQQLRHVDLSDNCQTVDEQGHSAGAQHLVTAAGRCTQLLYLNLSSILPWLADGIDLDGGVAQSLADAAINWGQLQQLILRHNLGLVWVSNCSSGDQKAAADLAAGLATAAQHLPQLQLMDFDFTCIGPAGAVALAAAAQHWQHLQELSLSPSDIGDEGVAAVAAAAEHWQQLQMVDLSGNRVSARGAAALAAAARHWPQLHHLNLEQNEIGAKGAIGLAAAADRWQQLQSLLLSDNLIGDKGAAALAVAAQRLDLSGNDIGAEGAAALGAAAERWRQLQALNLSYNGIGDKGAAALAAAAQHWQQLQCLYVSSNNVGDEGKAALLNGFQHCQQVLL